MLFVILVACLAAPLYASLVSGTEPFRSNLSGKIMVGGKRTAVMQPSTKGLRLGVTPIGPDLARRLSARRRRAGP